MDKTVNISLGGSFLSMLAILFIALKLLNVINWSWWWVLAPIWIPIAVVLAVLLVIVIVLLISSIIS